MQTMKKVWVHLYQGIIADDFAKINQPTADYYYWNGLPAIACATVEFVCEKMRISVSTAKNYHLEQTVTLGFKTKWRPKGF